MSNFEDIVRLQLKFYSMAVEDSSCPTDWKTDEIITAILQAHTAEMREELVEELVATKTVMNTDGWPKHPRLVDWVETRIAELKKLEETE